MKQVVSRLELNIVAFSSSGWFIGSRILQLSVLSFNELLDKAKAVFKEISCSQKQAVDVEKSTREQRNSDVWTKMRTGRVTASNFHQMCRTDPTKPVNVDLQPIFNHYKCVTYVCSYFTKDETECSQAIVNAAKEAKTSNLNIRDSLRKIGAAFLSTREVSSQECVYRCMPELWLRKVFPKTVFLSTDLPDKRIRVAKSQQKLQELHHDSTDIYYLLLIACV